MLTLRIRYKADGTESIYQAHSLMAHPGNLTNPPSIIDITFQEAGGAEVIAGGDVDVYVMNDAGKTVAVYNLTSNPYMEVGSKEQ